MISHKKLPNMRSRCEASPAAARRCSMTAAQRRAAGRRRRRGGPAACTLHRAPTSTPRVMPSWFDPAVRNAPVRRRPPPPGPLPDVGARAHPRRLTQDVRAITEGIPHAVCSNERRGASGKHHHLFPGRSRSMDWLAQTATPVRVWGYWSYFGRLTHVDGLNRFISTRSFSHLLFGRIFPQWSGAVP